MYQTTSPTLYVSDRHLCTIFAIQLFVQAENDQDLPRAARRAAGLPEGVPHGGGRDLRRLGPLLRPPRGRHREAAPARLGRHDVRRGGLREAHRGLNQGRFKVVGLVRMRPHTVPST